MPLAERYSKAQIAAWAALIITLFCKLVPLNPLMPGASLDQAWEYGINQAIVNGMAFGRDVVFTFGPYASTYTRVFHPALDGQMLFSSTYLALTYVVATFVVAERAKSVWLILFAAAVAITEWRDALLFSQCLISGIAAKKLIARISNQLENRLTHIACLFLTLSPLGLLPLIKGSVLALSLGVIFISIASALQTRRPQLILVIISAPLLTCLASWILAGQNLLNLLSYFEGIIQLSAGYTEGMQIAGPAEEIIVYIATALLFLIALLHCGQNKSTKFSAALLFSIYSFVAFKAGFVRHDGHAQIAASSLLLAGATALFILSPRISTATFLLALGASTSISLNYNHDPFLKMGAIALKTFSESASGVSNRLDADNLITKFHAAVTKIAKEKHLPILQGSSDIYSYGQSYLISSGNDWNPRPIMQSYAAYTKRLAERNSLHLTNNGPSNIFFGIEPIDGRFPSLEDGSSWLALLQHYTPSSLSSGLLILKNENKGPAELKAELFSSATLNESISVPESEYPLYLKLRVVPTAAGKIASFLFKSKTLQIKITKKDRSTQSFRLVAGMASGGFLLSPLIEKAEDFALLYGGEHLLRKNRVVSFSITSPDDEENLFWKNNISYSISKTENSLKHYDSAEIWKKQNRESSHEVNNAMQRDCKGSLDFINNAPAASAVFDSKLFTVSGWLADSVDPQILTKQTYVIFSRPNERPKLFEAYKMPRPDVAGYFKSSKLTDVGYIVFGDAGDMRGKYKVGMAFKSERGLEVCNSPTFDVTITDKVQ